MSNEKAHAVTIAAMTLSMCTMWCDIPKETNWVAQDADGEWFAYPRKPVLRSGIWNMLVRSEEALRLGMGDKPKNEALMIFSL